MRIGKWLAALAAAVLLLGGIYFLAPRDEPEIATITEMNGALQWTGDGGRVVRDLEAGSVLHGGTLESLSADSWAVLTFRDRSTVTLSGRSTLTISEGWASHHQRGAALLTRKMMRASGSPAQIMRRNSSIYV